MSAGVWEHPHLPRSDSMSAFAYDRHLFLPGEKTIHEAMPISPLDSAVDPVRLRDNGPDQQLEESAILRRAGNEGIGAWHLQSGQRAAHVRGHAGTSLDKKGVQTVASYTLIPSDGPIAEDALEKAVEQAGVDGVLVTRMVGRQTEISVSPSPMPPAAYGMRWQYYGYYTGAWRSYYERQRCRRLNTLTPKPRCSGRTRRSRSGRAPRGR